MTRQGYAAEQQPMRCLNAASKEPHHTLREASRPKARRISYRPPVCTVTQMHGVNIYIFVYYITFNAPANRYELSLPEVGNELSA